jgi:transcriptional regulator with XRE-family HTH domain
MTIVETVAPAAYLRRGAAEDVKIVPGLLVAAVFGTNAGMSLRPNLRHHVLGITTVPAVERRETVVAEEVRRLRDDICRRGLTRQDVARGIGVDRRSLSGYASGEINPQAERLEALRILARVTREIAAEHPGQVRDIVVTRRGDTTLLDAIAAGRYAIAAAWRTWVAGLRARVEVRSRFADQTEPIWSAAMHALADGRLAAPARAATVRPETTYEMETVEAADVFDEPDLEQRRPGYP